MSDIIWTNDIIKLGDVDLWEYNPRFSTEEQAKRIVDSHRMFGQVDLIAVGPKNDNGKYPCYNGHQRVNSWLAEYGPDYEIDVRRASRMLTDEERQALTVMLHVGATGSWDWESLVSWDSDILQGFGFDEDLLKNWQKDSFALGDFLEILSEFGDTSVDRNGQGVSSTWGQVNSSKRIKCIVGDIETSIDCGIAQSILDVVTDAYDNDDTPISETIERIFRRGIENSDS